MSKNTLNEIWKNNIDSMTIEELILQLEINHNIANQIQILSNEFLGNSHERVRLLSILRTTHEKEAYIASILKEKI